MNYTLLVEYLEYQCSFAYGDTRHYAQLEHLPPVILNRPLVIGFFGVSRVAFQVPLTWGCDARAVKICRTQLL